MVNLALDGTGFCPVKSSSTFDAGLQRIGTFGEFITGLTDADVEYDFLDSDLSHGIFLFNFGGHDALIDIKKLN
jgi:hypothetical protein